MVRSSGGSEVYDLAWSPDGVYFITGSMDNIARIYNAQTGHIVRQIAEHQHYVQGVAWDPLNEYIATQSSDRSVHIYTLKTKEGTYTLDNRDDPDKGLGRVGINLKMDLPGRRISFNSPAPPLDMALRSQIGFGKDFSVADAMMGSPVPSCPGTPNSIVLPMNPPSTISHSRRSSFGAASPAMSLRRSMSPAPSLPLPAVMPMEASPKPYALGVGAKNVNIYANDALKSFFRRLTFTPDGSLLFTPAGQYQTPLRGPEEAGVKSMYEVMNTVYIYTRGGINKPPVAHLPGHKKPSVVVKCSPVYYSHRKLLPVTKHFTIDSSSADGSMAALPEPAAALPKSPTPSVMDPPQPIPQLADPLGLAPSPTVKPIDNEVQGPSIAFNLPYRIVYAVATEDAVLLYDTQQQSPICVVSNLHCASFTDLTWSNDGLTLLMTSSDGFCSALTFSPGELGEKYVGETPPASDNTFCPSQITPMATPVSVAPPSPFPSSHHRTTSNSGIVALSSPARPSSPTRSNSTCSMISNPPLVQSSVPSLAASNNVSLISQTPPQTPSSASERGSQAPAIKSKRDASENEGDAAATEHERNTKRRRIAPTRISESSSANRSAGGPVS